MGGCPGRGGQVPFWHKAELSGGAAQGKQAHQRRHCWAASPVCAALGARLLGARNVSLSPGCVLVLALRVKVHVCMLSVLLCAAAAPFVVHRPTVAQWRWSVPAHSTRPQCHTDGWLAGFSAAWLLPPGFFGMYSLTPERLRERKHPFWKRSASVWGRCWVRQGRRVCFS